MSNRAFVYVTPIQLSAIHPTSADELERLIALSRRTPRKCENCDEPEWLYGDTGMCFSCTTGESDASNDYELIPEPIR